VDLLYRNVEQVERALNENQTGIYHHHFYQQPTFGFVSVVYLAETQCCLPLFDRQHLLSEFKRRVEIYSSPLQARLTKDCLSMAEFTFIHAFGFAQLGDIFNTVGCLTRIAFMLAQALFAMNAKYYFGDKGCLEAIKQFARQPNQFSRRLENILALRMANPAELESAVRQMQVLWQEVADLPTFPLRIKSDS
jgi:hypothetical protein